VLALGDLQYEWGLRANFKRTYDRTWGRLKAVTIRSRATTRIPRAAPAVSTASTKTYTSTDRGCIVILVTRLIRWF
jgi:hypothetical protein